MAYMCERCKICPARPGIKYCSSCRKEVLKKWAEEGYLQRITYGHCGDKRPAEAKELVYETIHGTGQG